MNSKIEIASKTRYVVFARSFDDIESAIAYGKLIDAFDIGIEIDGVVISTHEIVYGN